MCQVLVKIYTRQINIKNTEICKIISKVFSFLQTEKKNPLNSSRLNVPFDILHSCYIIRKVSLLC